MFWRFQRIITLFLPLVSSNYKSWLSLFLNDSVFFSRSFADKNNDPWKRNKEKISLNLFVLMIRKRRTTSQDNSCGYLLVAKKILCFCFALFFTSRCVCLLASFFYSFISYKIRAHQEEEKTNIERKYIIKQLKHAIAPYEANECEMPRAQYGK